MVRVTGLGGGGGGRESEVPERQKLNGKISGSNRSTQNYNLTYSLRVSEAGLHEWMPFVIFRARSRERPQRHFRADFRVGVASRCV